MERKRVDMIQTWLPKSQWGGYDSNLAPKKPVGKLLNFFDSTTYRVVGGLPPMPPSTSSVRAQGKENNQQAGNKVSTSQSTMAMSSFVSSATKDPKSERKGDSNRKIMHNRSASEPSFRINPSDVSFLVRVLSTLGCLMYMCVYTYLSSSLKLR